MNPSLLIRGTVLVILAAACVSWTSRASDCTPREARRLAALVIVNHTSCPIEVFIDDRNVVRCEPLARQTIRTARCGEIRLSGRSRCDSWGPVTKRLAPGKTAVWRLGASNRKSR